MNLLLVSTPLQALIAEAVLRTEQADAYDLVYSARSDLESHRHYYERLRTHAQRSAYAAGGQGSSQALRYMARRAKLDRPFFRKRYDRIYLASIESLLFRRLIARNRSAEVVSFDDGAANVFGGSRYYTPRTLATASAEFALRCPSVRQVRARIRRHYSLYADQQNLVEPARLRFLSLWSHLADGMSPAAAEGTVSFFLGQPFSEAVESGTLDSTGPGRIEDWLNRNPVDHYLAHPRETRPLRYGHGTIRRSTAIAEEEIFTLSAGKRPRLYGWFTTVLLNVPAAVADKVYLSVGGGAAEAERTALMARAGCEVLHV
jgi:hypothetical protein